MDISANPWGGIQERANNFARQDSRLGAHLKKLSEQEALDNKLAVAIEAGRVYGLRQQKYLRKQVTAEARHPLVQPMW